jgi:hypothetical protein
MHGIEVSAGGFQDLSELLSRRDGSWEERERSVRMIKPQVAVLRRVEI